MSRSCLIVDDSKIIRRIGRQIIEGLGFQCTEAEDGVMALEATKQSLPDVVLLDWNMPNMNGYDYMLSVRAMPDGHKPVIIFCTTESRAAQIEKALAGGANEYIMKPFDAEIVRDKFIQTGLLS